MSTFWAVLLLFCGIILGSFLATIFNLAEIPVIGRLLKSKKRSTLEKELASVRNKLTKIQAEKEKLLEEQRQQLQKSLSEEIERSRKRINYLKQLAFSDGQYKPEERDLIFNYILNEDCLDDQSIVEEMRTFYKHPGGVLKSLKTKISLNDPRRMFTKKEEAEEFVITLEELAKVDENISKTEKQLIDKIKDMYKIP